MTSETSLSQETLKHRLSELPGNIRPHIKMGFHLFSRVSVERQRSFVEYIVFITQNGKSLDRDKVIEITGLDENTITDVLSATAMTIGAISDIEVSTEDFVNAGRDLIFEDDDSEGVRLIVDHVVSSRRQLHSGMEVAALANSILPSFRSLHIEVDMRMKFEDGKDEPEGGVAVAVCNLKTDCTDDVWFQMSLSSVENLVERLNRIARRLKSAEDCLKSMS